MCPADFKDLSLWLRQQQAEAGDKAFEPALVEELCSDLERSDFANPKPPSALELYGLIEQSTRARGHVLWLIERYSASHSDVFAVAINHWFNSQLTDVIERFNQAVEHQAKAQRYTRLAEFEHELRTPLNAFSMGTELLEMSLTNRQTGDRVDQVLQTMRRSIQRMGDIIHRINGSGEHSH